MASEDIDQIIYIFSDVFIDRGGVMDKYVPSSETSDGQSISKVITDSDMEFIDRRSYVTKTWP